MSPSPDATVPAATVNAPGQPPVAGRVPFPVSAEGESLVRVEFAALNPADLMVAAGAYGPPPATPWVIGLEGVGVVERSKTVPPGTRVWWRASGSAAGRVSVADHALVPVGEDVSPADAAAVGIAGTTAWLALTQHASLRQGESVLVLGATGAVGTFAVQLARLLGAGHVTAAGRDRHALAALNALGATDTLALGEDGSFVPPAGQGYDVVIDAVFGSAWPAVLTAGAPGARIVVLGASAGMTATATGEIIGKGLTIAGLNGGLLAPDLVAGAYRALLGHLVAGELSVRTDVVSLSAVTEAWGRQGSSPHTKLLVGFGDSR